MFKFILGLYLGWFITHLASTYLNRTPVEYLMQDRCRELSAHLVSYDNRSFNCETKSGIELNIGREDFE